jgi:hypothetical protein
MRSVVLIHGLLRGMGHEADCEMVAIRDTLSSSRPSVYTRWSVLDAPDDLPDGCYTVCFDGRAVPVRREGGLWLANEPPIPSAT